MLAEQARDLRAGIPRWYQYRGESVEFLATIGVNGIVLDQPPTANLLREARRLRLGVVAPVPPVAPTETQADDWQAIVSWSLDGRSMNPMWKLHGRLPFD